MKSNTLYDANGNAEEYITFEGYNDTTQSWGNKGYRTVYTYVQINACAALPKSVSTSKNPVMSVKNQRIHFSARDITGISIYTISGKCVYSVKQPVSSSIHCRLANKGGNLCTGHYFVELECKGHLYNYSLIYTE